MSFSGLGDSPTAPELSLEEWFALPEETSGELVDGQLAEEEVPDYLHELLVMLLGRLLGNWISPQGGLVAGPMPSSPSARGVAGSPTLPSTFRAAVSLRPRA